ncbi:hypothetical protein EJ110_NYTH21477 [Nymphaea thermarum]|nr:hypothetical protein EJ110_NYTH21477 [Nymphaea thermarum]
MNQPPLSLLRKPKSDGDDFHELVPVGFSLLSDNPTVPAYGWGLKVDCSMPNALLHGNSLAIKVLFCPKKPLKGVMPENLGKSIFGNRGSPTFSPLYKKGPYPTASATKLQPRPARGRRREEENKGKFYLAFYYWWSQTRDRHLLFTSNLKRSSGRNGFNAVGIGRPVVNVVWKLLFGCLLLGVKDGHFFIGSFHCLDKQAYRPPIAGSLDGESREGWELSSSYRVPN